MKIEIKKTVWPSMISSIGLLLLGLLLFFKSGATLVAISYIIGAILIALGVIAIIKYVKSGSKDIFNQLNIVYGVISAIAGIFLITTPEMIGSIIPIVVGIAIIISSSLKLQQALAIKTKDNNYWISSLVTAILCLICGVVILFNPFTSAVVVTRIIGLFITIYAVLDIANSILLKKGSSISVEISKETIKNKDTKRKVKDAKIIKEEETEE